MAAGLPIRPIAGADRNRKGLSCFVSDVRSAATHFNGGTKYDLAP
jgi:hypothetical protein